MGKDPPGENLGLQANQSNKVSRPGSSHSKFRLEVY